MCAQGAWRWWGLFTYRFFLQLTVISFSDPGALAMAFSFPSSVCVQCICMCTTCNLTLSPLRKLFFLKRKNFFFAIGIIERGERKTSSMCDLARAKGSFFKRRVLVWSSNRDDETTTTTVSPFSPMRKGPPAESRLSVNVALCMLIGPRPDASKPNSILCR